MVKIDASAIAILVTSGTAAGTRDLDISKRYAVCGTQTPIAEGLPELLARFSNIPLGTTPSIVT